MADKSFGVKELNLLNASGTPTVTSPNNLNLNANTVAISTSCTIGNNLTVTSTTNSANLNVTGIGTLTRAFATDLSVSGVTTITVPANANPHSSWDVVNNSASAYRFTGPGQDGAEDNPNIYLVRGQRYVFKMNASGHPFQIRVANAGAAYSDGVTNNGSQTGNVVFNVQHDAPAQLFYQCTSHGSMVGNIYIVGGPQVISGVVTATTFVGNLTGNPTGSGANLTNLPAANITGTLPAISGANLTGISVDNISEGNTKAEVVDTGAGHFKVETDGSERFRVNDNGMLTTGGETSPDVVAGGLCLNTGAQDGIFLSCKNSDIAHGRTSLDETDTLFSMRKISGDKGGVDIRGYTDAAGGDPAIRIFGTIDDSSDAGYCPVELRGARKNTGGNTGTSGIPADRGVVRISNDGDNTVATFTGEGLCFHSDTAAANALDDYEEGSWTPTAHGYTGSNTTNNCFYTKIGRLVIATFRITWPSLTNSAAAEIRNLPFTCMGQAVNTFGGSFAETNDNDNLTMIVQQNTTSLYILRCTSSGVDTQTISEVSGKDFRGTAIYFTSS